MREYICADEGMQKRCPLVRTDKQAAGPEIRREAERSQGAADTP